MSSPISPVIANFFMEDFEKKAIEEAKHTSRHAGIDMWTTHSPSGSTDGKYLQDSFTT